jgi:hypothetical protein
MVVVLGDDAGVDITLLEEGLDTAGLRVDGDTMVGSAGR